MAKVLKPYTIIPPDLYVERDADRQISNIIEDMGRPGYVLVSRQMGKTNLLLNAKRRLESPEDVFVYIDLSNPFESAKSCFENIIDTAIETNELKLGSIQKEIQEGRIELKENPAHKIHTVELRNILKTIKGKLVIILDEIDALTKTQYSDQIFAQIRSVYFSRVNFKELERLTYILSGVIEPTEIIKDPKISPFNIGQKIFLNDFSKNEFENFIIKASLLLNPNVKDRIFFWTNGNPRMTWDVCAEVEALENQVVSEETIDSIVKNLYLTSYDKPPIDNIRDLVKNDRELRDAIVEIGYKKGKQVSDKVKNKLYLAGIINYEDNDIQIKNNVISQSLSLDWVRSLEEADKGLVKVAFELFDKENYDEALDTFERYISENQFEEQHKSLCFYQMGYAAYRTSQHEKAIRYFNSTNFNSDDETKLFYRVSLLKAMAYFYNNQIEESILSFKTVIDSGRRDETYVRALLNYGAISVKSNIENHKLDAIKIFKNVVEGQELDKEKLTPEFITEIKSVSHYNLGQIEKHSGNIEGALSNLRNAIALSKDNTKPEMILNLLELITDEKEKHSLVSEIVGLIVSEKVNPNNEDIEKPLDFGLNTVKNIFVLTLLNYRDELFSKLKPFLKYLGKETIAKNLYSLALYSVQSTKKWNDARGILKEIYNNSTTEEYALDDATHYSTLKLLAYSADIKKSLDYHLQYTSLFEKNRFEPVDYIDMEIFANLIHNLTERQKYKEAIKKVDLITSIKETVSESNLLNYLVIYHLELNLLAFLNDWDAAVKKAKEILVLADNEKINKQTSNLLGDTGLEVIRRNAESFLTTANGTPNRTPIKVEKIDRWEIVKVRYKDGHIVSAKYKKVENDIKDGKCVIIK